MKRLPSSLSAEAIQRIWNQSRDSKHFSAGAAGVDNVSAAVFSSRLAEHIAQIRDDIRLGAYRFDKLRMAPVPKPSGGHRIIAIPTIRDRLLQRALLGHLESDPHFSATSPISFGFTKGKTLSCAQRRALTLRQAHPWVLQADIVKFFDRIRRPDIKALICKHVRRKVIADLLCAAVDCEIEDGGGRGAEIARTSGVQKGLGLRQGMPVSPLLSNLLLKGFDDALAKRSINAVRYADDIAVFADSRNECHDTLSLIQESLSKLDLRVPELAEENKTVVSAPSAIVGFLGVEIRRFGEKYKLCAPARKLADIDADMAAIASIEQCVKEKRNIGHVVRTLDSFIIGHSASMAVLDEADEFISRLEAAKQNHLKKLLSSLIGAKAVKSLDDDRLSILGLKPFKR